MKKNSVLLFIFLAFTVQGISQWEWLYPNPQGNRLNDLFFIDPDTIGFAVGDRGVILKTENKGINWSQMDSVTTNELNSGCIAGNKGFIVGDNGLILKTTDNENWNKLESGTHYRLNSIEFTDDNAGYIAGYKGLILKTADAGESWQLLNSETLYSLYSICFITPDLGIIVGDSGLILRTTNAGETWDKQSSGTQLGLLDVHFSSATIGYITGKKGIILKTTNAGETWSDISFDPMEEELYSVHFYNDTLGYTAGAYGAILRTTNGGATWTFFSSGTDLAIRSIFQFIQNDTLCDSLILCGDNGLIKRTDSCGYLKNVTSASSYTFNSVSFDPNLHGFAVGGDPFGDKPFMLRTPGPGSAWEPYIVDTMSHYLTDICYLANTTYYVSGKKGSIYKTPDNGNYWFPLNTGTNENLYSVCFIGENIGFATGDNGTIIKTISGDTTWTKLITGITRNLYSLVFINDGQGGYAVGDQGTILRIENGGSQISSLQSGTNNPLYDIFFPTDNVGFIVGYAGKIIKIKRGILGDSLFTIPSGILTPLNKVYFPNPDIGYIAGEGGVILKSTDGGETWYPQYTGTSNSLRGIYFINDTLGFAVGAGVTVLKTINGGGGVILPGIPEKEMEEMPIRIYPNPGSDYVWIEYQLSENSQVLVGIFDLSGRKIREFINTKTESGIQKLMFDISGIETGIYIVALQSKNRIYSRKLIVF
jgi:photosystem II stability/assembly factor-like uncharacterized protein